MPQHKSRFTFQRLEERIAPSCLSACYEEPDDDCDNGQDKVKGNNGVGNGVDPQPPGNPPVNDGEGTGPGNPGNRGLGRR